MSLLSCTDRDELLAALPALTPGDCVQIESLDAVASNTKELLAVLSEIDEHGADFVSLQEEIDTRVGQRTAFFAFCRALGELDRAERREKRREGVEKAREEGRYKGRKPIAVDEGLFESVVELWQSGQISARQAMAQLDLKPNTFYRRIKEREEQKMKDYKKVEQELKAEIKEAAKQGRRDLDELKKQVKAEAKQVKAEAREVKKAADEKLELHDVEREMRHDRIRAEIEHRDTVKQMKKDVEAEAKELKKMLED